MIRNKTFCGDGILTSNHLPWESDVNLLDAYNLSFENIPAKYKTIRSMQFRAHIVTFCAHITQGVKGDYIELGTWYGVLAKTICNQPELVTGRNFYLVDPFGMPGFKMKGKYKNGSYEEDIFEIVKYRFRNDSCVKLIRGVVPDVLSSVPVDKVAFLLIDMNHGEPEIQGLEFFWNKIPSGGIVYFDDYGQDFPELRKHIDLFLEDKKERILIFPTGQAILIKM